MMHLVDFKIVWGKIFCLSLLFHIIIVVKSTTFVQFFTTSHQLVGRKLNVTNEGPTWNTLHLLSMCAQIEDCQAVSAQRQELLTNVTSISATNGHPPTYYSKLLRGRKFYVNTGGNKTWFEARDDCQSLGGFLVTANTLDDLTAALAVMSDPDGNYWLGGNDLDTEGVFTWHIGERQTIDGTMWNPGQPDNSKGQEHCLVSYRRKLYDIPCHQYRNYMCEILL